ncbi:MAG: hypothetical protein HC799_11865 [Limnothrix sp. RL_2_0]|nr:hypothetical protein [Limnothrix sp. RL_2_0]
MFDVEQLELWFPEERRSPILQQLIQSVGLTRMRADYFLRLWIYLCVKAEQAKNPQIKPPLPQLKTMFGSVICTHSEAAELFYCDKDQGGDRSAGMMLDKLAALRLIRKHFDGNTTCIEILPLPKIIQGSQTEQQVTLKLDDFDPRCDAIPVANLLAINYNWMNNNNDAVPHRISRLLRQWGNQYGTGMRVLRRVDNANPVAFYLLYPTKSTSDLNFFKPAKNALHLSTMSEIDPFEMAIIGDKTCTSVFIRSWMIDPLYLREYQAIFLQDAQQTLIRMQQDFPNLCDLHTLIIHPTYAQLGSALGFQHTHQDSRSSIHWMYLALDRFVALDVQQAIAQP